MKICTICGKEYQETRSDQKTCKSVECKREQSRLWRVKNKPVVKKRRKRCPYCKKLYTPVHKKQITCGSKDCIRYHKNTSRKKEEREFECQVCGDKTWSSNPNVVLCGKKSCRKTYQLDFNKKGQYRKKYKKKHCKNAKVSGKYTDAEVELMINYRLRGKNNAAIAKKLKRKIISIDKKIVNVFRSDKYSDLIEAKRIELAPNEEMSSKKINRDIDKWNRLIENYFKEN